MSYEVVLERGKKHVDFSGVPSVAEVLAVIQKEFPADSFEHLEICPTGPRSFFISLNRERVGPESTIDASTD